MSAVFTTKIGIYFLKQIAKISFSLLYVISDMLSFIVYYLVRYRRKIVTLNLRNAFPEKDADEIKKISKKFYRHLCDLMVETIKMGQMKKTDYQDRMELKGIDRINRFYEQGKSVVVLTMHYNNWEWSNWIALNIKHEGLAVYKPLHNHLFDKYLNKIRSKMGANMIQNSQVLRTVIHAQKNNQPVFIWLAGDQTPPEFHKFWMRFLNQEAVFYPGPAAISKKFNLPLIFQRTEKTGRGKYVSHFELLFETTEGKSENEIMKAYIRSMEQAIRKNPEFYLWSHKRWKHKRPEYVPLQD